ncbi:hypothetical protein ABVB72_23325 [Rhizobium nepotum]|uniref:hypothetical protein n=1 Tax=Rhizobium nepotum TaxID=1035271 RepID=UPI00336A8255
MKTGGGFCNGRDQKLDLNSALSLVQSCPDGKASATNFVTLPDRASQNMPLWPIVLCALTFIGQHSAPIDTEDGNEVVHGMKPEDPRTAHKAISLTEAFSQISNARRRRKILDLVRAIAASNSINGDEHLQDAAE